jgi:hypothetical protein
MVQGPGVATLNGIGALGLDAGSFSFPVQSR